MITANITGSSGNVIITWLQPPEQPGPPDAAVPAPRPRLPGAPPVLAAAYGGDGVWAVAR